MLKSKKSTVKKEIKQAFLDLLLQKDYMDITVSDLVNKAQVSRTSFYRNFDSTDNVIDEIADEIIQGFNNDIVPALEANEERKWRELLFEMLYRTMQIQKKVGVPSNDFTNAHENISVLMSRVHDKIVRTESELPAQSAIEKYANIGKLNLIQGIIHEWMIMGMRETPEEIIDIILPMVMKL